MQGKANAKTPGLLKKGSETLANKLLESGSLLQPNVLKTATDMQSRVVLLQTMASQHSDINQDHPPEQLWKLMLICTRKMISLQKHICLIALIEHIR